MFAVTDLTGHIVSTHTTRPEAAQAKAELQTAHGITYRLEKL